MGKAKSAPRKRAPRAPSPVYEPGPVRSFDEEVWEEAQRVGRAVTFAWESVRRALVTPRCTQLLEVGVKHFRSILRATTRTALERYHASPAEKARLSEKDQRTQAEALRTTTFSPVLRTLYAALDQPDLVKRCPFLYAGVLEVKRIDLITAVAGYYGIEDRFGVRLPEKEAVDLVLDVLQGLPFITLEARIKEASE